MENLEDIKVGDKVVAHNQYGKVIRTVKRLTKTLIVLDDDTRYRKNDGLSSSIHGFFVPSIKRATSTDVAEIKEAIKRKKLIGKICGYSWDELSTEELEKVCEIINK